MLFSSFQALKDKEQELLLLRDERSTLEINLRRRFQEEKDEVLKLLEAEYSEREKEAVLLVREEVQRDSDQKLKQIAHENEEGMRHQYEELERRFRSEVDQEKCKIECECEARHKSQLEEQRLEWEREKEKCIKELVEKLNQEHKIELEGLRSRFRLMATASMERSPSDSSLEKIEVRSLT